MRLLSTIFILSLFLLLPINNFSQTADPASITVYQTAGPITVDGQLTEASWSLPFQHLRFKIGSTPLGYHDTPTGFAVVKPEYMDTSTCFVRFLHDGTNLYISLNSDDKQVCRFGDSWEGDGLFMKIKNSAAADLEYKLYFNLAGVNPEIHYEGNSAGTGAGFKNPGTVVNDSTNVDAGYTAELKIDLTALGFDASTPSVQVLINIFDPDNYSDGVLPWGPNGNYAKQWWGSEWGPDMRTLQLSQLVVPVQLTAFTASIVGNSAQLNWSTATEINNRGFDVERSINNSGFTAIGFVKGNGTSTNTQNYSFTDQNLNTGTKYSYRLKQIDMNGQFTYSQVAELGTITPVEFALNQNYPNPFNPSTKVSFSLPVKSNVTLDLYNLLGQKVMSLINSSLDAGNHDYNLDASRLNSGVYIYTISASGENGSTFISSKKMTLIK